jgi:hypothetical protein
MHKPVPHSELVSAPCSPVGAEAFDMPGVVTAPTMAAPGFFFDEIGDRPSMNEGPTGEAGAPNLSTFFDDPFFEKCRGDRPCRCKSCKPSLAGAVL